MDANTYQAKRQNINDKEIFIVGSGKLANAIVSSGMAFPACEMVKMEDRVSTFNDKAIVLHAGSGRQLDECLSFCKRTDSILIELSIGLKNRTAYS